MFYFNVVWKGKTNFWEQQRRFWDMGIKTSQGDFELAVLLDIELRREFKDDIFQ